MGTLEKHEAYIRHFLHTAPSEDIEEFARQARQANWLARQLYPDPKKKK